MMNRCGRERLRDKRCAVLFELLIATLKSASRLASFCLDCDITKRFVMRRTPDPLIYVPLFVCVEGNSVQDKQQKIASQEVG